MTKFGWKEAKDEIFRSEEPGNEPPSTGNERPPKWDPVPEMEKVDTSHLKAGFLCLCLGGGLGWVALQLWPSGLLSKALAVLTLGDILRGLAAVAVSAVAAWVCIFSIRLLRWVSVVVALLILAFVADIHNIR
jgi:hypothetical protein